MVGTYTLGGYIFYFIQLAFKTSRVILLFTVRKLNLKYEDDLCSSMSEPAVRVNIALRIPFMHP